MKKLDYKKEVEIMNRIQRSEKRGEMNFSSMLGDDEYDGDDSYDGDDNLIGVDGYFGNDMYNGQPTGQQKQGVGVLRSPQRTISVNFTNQSGIAGAGLGGNSVASDLALSIFYATINMTPGIPALGLLKNNPQYNALIDGRSYIGTGSAVPGTPDTGNALVVSSDTASFTQIISESQSSPYQIYGSKIFCSYPIQLRKAYQTVEHSVLGAIHSQPYTPGDKFSANQFQQNIIEDTSFKLSFDGNQEITYTLLSPVNAGTAGSPNYIQFNWYLWKIVEADRQMRGKHPMVVTSKRGMPDNVQKIKFIQ